MIVGVGCPAGGGGKREGRGEGEREGEWCAEAWGWVEGKWREEERLGGRQEGGGLRFCESVKGERERERERERNKI